MREMEGAGLMVVACCVSGSTVAEFPTSRRQHSMSTGTDWALKVTSPSEVWTSWRNQS
jgi:hypothetical protein